MAKLQKNVIVQRLLLYHGTGLIIILWYIFFVKHYGNRGSDLAVMIGIVYYVIILVYIAQHYFLEVAVKLIDKMPPFLLKGAQIFRSLCLIAYLFWVLIFLVRQLHKILKDIKDRLFFENRDPRCLGVEYLGFSERVEFVLRKEKGQLSLDQLIMAVLYTPESILEIEGLGPENKRQIFQKTYRFINTSYALTVLFKKNHKNLKGKPWWFIFFILMTRKNPQFRFISELELSTRVKLLLLNRGIYRIEELCTIVSTTEGCDYLLLYITDFQYEDFLEIFPKLERWYVQIRKAKKPVFKFITQLGLSERVTLLLLYEDLYTIEQLKKSLKKAKSRKALLEIEDFRDEDFCQIFTKVEQWYRMIGKTQRSVFQFITELGLSPRVTVLLLKKGLYTVDRLRLTVRDPETREILIQTEDFETEDLLEIFKKLDSY